MKKSILALSLLAASGVVSAGPWTVINSWTYVNEAGFLNATTGYADEGGFIDPYNHNGTATDVAGGITTMNPDYTPVDSSAHATPWDLTSEPAPTAGATQFVNSGGYNWFVNQLDGMWYNYGTSTSPTVGRTGTSDNGDVDGSILDANVSYDVFDSACWGLENQPAPSCVVFKDENGNDSSRITGTATTGMYGSQTFNTGTSITHENRPAGAPSLTSINLIDGLELASSDLTGGKYLAPELILPINFVETFEGSNAIWPEAPDDMFVIDFSQVGTSGILFNVGADFIDFFVDVTFTDGDFASNGADYHKDYVVTTRLSGLDFFSGPGGSTIAGILTKENQDNTLMASFSIQAVRVAEPGALGLFGLGLLGLAGMARRRRQN